MSISTVESVHEYMNNLKVTVLSFYKDLVQIELIYIRTDEFKLI